MFMGGQERMRELFVTIIDNAFLSLVFLLSTILSLQPILVSLPSKFPTAVMLSASVMSVLIFIHVY